MSFIVIVQLTALPEWLRLGRDERQEVICQHVEPLLEQHPECRIRWFDAEAFTALCSDVMLVESSGLAEWNHLWEGIRDTPLFANPYFKLEAIIPAIEDGFRDYEATLTS